MTAVAGVLVLVGVLSGPMGRAVMASDRFDAGVSRTRVVRDGETLWSIAATVAPGRDPREVIDEIEHLNQGIVASSLVQGQVLRIPALD